MLLCGSYSFLHALEKRVILKLLKNSPLVSQKKYTKTFLYVITYPFV